MPVIRQYLSCTLTVPTDLMHNVIGQAHQCLTHEICIPHSSTKSQPLAFVMSPTTRRAHRLNGQGGDPPQKKSVSSNKPQGRKRLYHCPNTVCGQCFSTVRAASIHLSKSPSCRIAAQQKLKMAYSLSGKQQQNVAEAPLEGGPSEAIFEDEDDVSGVQSLGDTLQTNPTTINNNLNQDMNAQLKHAPFSTNFYMETKLLHILESMNAPHTAFRDIMLWVAEGKQRGYNYEHTHITRAAQISRIEQYLNLTTLRPQQIPVALAGEDNLTIDVTIFDFKSQLLSLLSDSKITSDITKLDVNASDPFTKFVCKNNTLGCVNSGEWYYNAWEYCCRSDDDFLVPIIFACDETQVSTMGQIGAWPIMFSTSLLSQELRNKPEGWRPLGYIYDLKIVESQSQHSRQSNDIKYTRIHQIIKAIINSFIKCQRDTSLHNITLALGPFTKLVNLKVPLAFIIGDMVGGDKLCSCSPSYQTTLCRICLKCNIYGKDTGDPLVECQKINMSKVKELVNNNDIEKLQALNQYNVDNAFFHVCFGGCPYGIFSAACPTEPLHALEIGIMKDSLSILINDILTNAPSAELDLLAQKMCKWPRQRYLSSGSDSGMPRLLWNHGISTLTHLSGKDRVGIMLTIIVISLTDDGKAFFDKQLTAKIHNNMRYIFQLLLCYWSWLKKPYFWSRRNKVAKKAAIESIRIMLRELKDLWPRNTGNGWDLPKFHEQLHVPDDITRNGAPRNTHSGPNEHNHIRNVKRPSQNTQKRRKTLDWQLGNRVTENYFINHAMHKMDDVLTQTTESQPPKDPDSNDGISVNATKGKLIIQWSNVKHPKYKFTWEKKNGQILLHLPKPEERIINALIQYTVQLVNNINIEHQQYTIPINCEFHHGDNVYRAHPNYKSNGAWYDWVMVRWNKDNTNKKCNQTKASSNVEYGDAGYIPNAYEYSPLWIRLMGVVEGQHLVVGYTTDTLYWRSTVFSTYWKIEYEDNALTCPMISVIEITSVVRPVLMIPENDTMNGYHEIWSPERWADEFQQSSQHLKKFATRSSH